MEVPTAPPETRPEAQAMLAFAAFLRDDPSAADHDAGDLAARFGLSPEIVREAIEVARRRRRPSGPERNHLRRSGAGARRVLEALSNHPIAAVIAAGVFPIAIGTVAGLADQPTLRIVTGAAWGVVVLLATLLCYGIGRLRTALGVAIALGPMFVLPGAIRTVLRPMEGALPLTERFLLGASMLSLLVAMLTVAAATVGGYMRMRSEMRREDRMGRLSLLERILDLQSRLEDEERPDPRREQPSWLPLARDRWQGFSLLVGVVLALTGLLIRLTVGIPDPSSEQVPTLAQFVPALLQMVMLLALTFLAGFCSGGWRNGLAAGALVLVGQNTLAALGLDGVGIGAMVEQYRQSPSLLALLLMYPMLGLIGGLAAAVEARADQQRRLLAADRAALLSEIVRLQQVLNTGAAEVCVLVVDCVKSTLMKQGADPLKVEASFRAFHDHIAAVCSRHGGRVISVAGDGAIAEFVGVVEAMACAREIQSRMAEFNARGNRLATPFRVRVGLHCGRVHGGLDEVVFNQVIDIAAHVERAAPAGGIAVTDEVRNHVPEQPFAELAARVDEHPVYIALDPA
ncbi:MAG: adenylate/guanylate cyclase domain-containing protein [Fimbriimonadaceae bacterium]|nr:adenylate/guanylate cyclase domain-containing protein [Chthonomonadaceae bacterium]MCO5296918.1 adenylate/guanylate cyclase domain-containing protein [Fimbriimonadaceae bacterium]